MRAAVAETGYTPIEAYPTHKPHMRQGLSRLPDTSIVLDHVLGRPSREEEQTRPEGRRTIDWVNYFNNNWQAEGLPKAWYNLRTAANQKVGFMMNRQMDMLQDPYNRDHLANWVQKTKRDLEGFKLEFLTDKVVYPRKYKRNPQDPSRLEDQLYGKSGEGTTIPDIAEIISEDERGGSVKRVVQKAKEFFTDAPDGSMAIITSPAGETGLKSDDGVPLKYPDSYFFVLQKNGDEVMNYSIKTDMSVQDCREAISKFTGIQLPKNAPIDWYLAAAAFIKPGEHKTITSVGDVVNTLEAIKPDRAFYDKHKDVTSSWADVRHQIGQGEELYKFDVATKEVIDEFETFGLQGIHSKQTLREGIAASILEMGEIFGRESDVAKLEKLMQQGRWHEVSLYEAKTKEKKSFKDVLQNTAARIGCAGGGQALIVETMGGKRVVVRTVKLPNAGEDGAGSLKFTCTEGHSNSRDPGVLKNTCDFPGCDKALC